MIFTLASKIALNGEGIKYIKKNMKVTKIQSIVWHTNNKKLPYFLIFINLPLQKKKHTWLFTMNSKPITLPNKT